MGTLLLASEMPVPIPLNRTVMINTNNVAAVGIVRQILGRFFPGSFLQRLVDGVLCIGVSLIRLDAITGALVPCTDHREIPSLLVHYMCNPIHLFPRSHLNKRAICVVVDSIGDVDHPPAGSHLFSAVKFSWLVVSNSTDTTFLHPRPYTMQSSTSAYYAIHTCQIVLRLCPCFISSVLPRFLI